MYRQFAFQIYIQIYAVSFCGVFEKNHLLNIDLLYEIYKILVHYFYINIF